MRFAKIFVRQKSPKFAFRQLSADLADGFPLGVNDLVIAPDGKIAEFEGAQIHSVPGLSFPLYPDMKLAIPRPSIGKALAAFEPDLIHVAQPILLGGSALYYSRARRVPLVISYHAQVDRYLHYYGMGFLEPLLWAGTKSV